MGAPAASMEWMPEDDRLLKNAVEAGASLESLAKGAIHFSRRYTLKEIHDRWYKLLYDLDTSIKASAHIIELEVDITGVNPPKPNRNSSSKGNEMAGKRNGDTVRSHYYALRKRICSESRSFDYSGFHMQQCFDPHSGHLVGNGSANSCGYDQPSLGSYEGIKTSNDAEQGFLIDDADYNDNTDVELCHLNNVDNLGDELIDGHCIPEYPQCTEQYEFRNMDNSYGNDLAGSDVPSISGGSAFLDLHVAQSTQPLPMDRQHESGAANPEAEADFLLRTSKQGRLRPEFREDVKSLVSEDTNTLHEPRSPTNVCFLTCRQVDEITSSSVPIVGDFKGNQVANSLSLVDNNKDIDSPKIHDADSKPRLNLGISEGVLDGSNQVLEILEGLSRSYDAFNSGGLLPTGSNESARVVDGEIHFESDVLDQVNSATLSNEDHVDAPGYNSATLSLNIDDESIPVEGFCVLNTEDPDIPCIDHILSSALHAYISILKHQNCNQSNLERSLAEFLVTNPITKLQKSDQECQLSECDNDVPSFSDIEAMILDMDLDPKVQDSGPFANEGSRYQYADTKEFIRPEQGTLSCMRRAISSHGAFAVFYGRRLNGRRLKHYIRTSKVSLGRATETVKVDIDLGREGRANTISRRQAIIGMDEGGSFFLTNVGKCSIFMNDWEVPSDKRIKLISGCLIEIKGMFFIFEVDQNAVDRYISRHRTTKKAAD